MKRQRPGATQIFARPADQTRKINLDELANEFPFKWRVQSFSKSRPLAICVPYCDARQVQDVFDAVCGSENWQDKYENVGGTLFCHIGIKIGNEWIWKSDCGTESNIEKEKGQASDAFKRAAIKWRVGRFLYSLRTYSLTANKKKEDGDKTFHLYCVDDKGVRLPDWSITDYINKKRGSKQAIPASNPNAKGEEKTSELDTIEEWANKKTTPHILTALGWLGCPMEPKDYKREGLAALPRLKYATFCHLVSLANYESDLVDMALEGFGFSDIGDAIKQESTEKLLSECKLIHKQEHRGD